MPRASEHKSTKKKPKISSGTKGRPRTVRLSHSDERWVDEQAHAQGFSGVISEAVRCYRELNDTQRQALLDAVT